MNLYSEENGGIEMSFTVYVKMKKLGKQRGNAPAPVPFVLDKQPGTVRELLTELVCFGVKAYNEKRENDQILSYLTKEEIENQALRGKISFGFVGGEGASAEEAIENAITCYEDGIYRVFAGDTELTELDGEIQWEEEPVFTLIRLTMLSGW